MQLKIVSFNAQDLFLTPAYEISPADLQTLSETQWQQLAPTDVRLKPLEHLRGIARMVGELDPDIIGICEVGGRASLENLNAWFLQGRFEVFLKPGPSPRGIDTGFLVKKSLGLRCDLVSHADWPLPFHYPHELDPKAHALLAEAAAYRDLGDPLERRLSRDIPALRVRNEAQELKLIVLMVHLKSGLDAEGFDPGGQIRRTAEVKALLEIYQTLKGDVPLIICGDFNGNASREGTTSEFLPIYAETELEDALWLKEVPKHERLTHFTFMQGRLMTGQIDYIFVPRSLPIAEAFVYLYRFDGDEGGTIMFPTSFHERRQLPSDHYPVVCLIFLK